MFKEKGYYFFRKGIIFRKFLVEAVFYNGFRLVDFVGVYVSYAVFFDIS
jgi:hypothetical protein